MSNVMHLKNVLVLTSTFPRYDSDITPSFIFDLCKQINKKFNVFVLAPHDKDLKSKETIQGLSIFRFRYFFSCWETLSYRAGILSNLRENPLRYLLLPCFLVAEFLYTLHIIRTKNIDVVHAHWLIPQGLIAALAILLVRKKIPLICTAHGSDLAINNTVILLIYRWLFKRMAALTVVSNALKQRAISQGAPVERISVIPMGVDVDVVFYPRAYGVRRDKLLFVGRLVNSKGVDVLLQAMHIILRKYPEQQLIIVGDGPELSSLLETVQHLQISHRVTFVGAITHQSLADFYNQASIMILPTREEGFGLTLIEALACECAVIASDIPAIHDIITHEETGLIVDVDDSVKLANAIDKLLSDSQLRDRLAVNGRKKVIENFSWRKIGYQYSAVIDHL